MRRYNMKRFELRRKMIDYLENDCAFRDYRILRIRDFRKVSRSGIHQIVLPDTIETDIDSSIETFCRDGYSTIYFYI